MVPGHVQGLSRVPPDHAEGGAGGELDSGGLWWTPNIQHPTSNIQHPTWNGRTAHEATQSDIKATPKRVDSQGIGTLKPP
jgi:hypothetical protein